MPKLIAHANRDCGKAIRELKQAISAASDAIASLDDMADELPASCVEPAQAHREVLRQQVEAMTTMLAERNATCKALTDCLAGGGITVQDGGGK